MHPLAPLNIKVEAAANKLEKLQSIIDECQAFIDSADIKPCPSCGHLDHVQITGWTHPNPEHDDIAIIIQCDKCHLQTKPQYWFITEAGTALQALTNCYQYWNTRPRDLQL